MNEMRKKKSRLLAGMIVCCMAVCTALAAPAGTTAVSASGTVTSDKTSSDKSASDKSASDKSTSDKNASDKTDKSKTDKTTSDKSSTDKNASEQSPEGSSVSGSGSFRKDESDKLAGAYEYHLEDGTMKYWLDLGGDDLKLHCMFRSGDPEYHEEVYQLPLDNAYAYRDTVIFNMVRNEEGHDITAQFALLSVTFKNGKAVLSAVRDEKSLAGGADSSILTGCYEMEARDGAAEGKSLPLILCRMAQGYYSRAYNYYPPLADYTANEEGTYTIHLYETVDEGDTPAHTATSAWYVVDAGGVGQDEILGIPVNIRR
jgi:hypothetical protein